jgi:hypothetical protein
MTDEIVIPAADQPPAPATPKPFAERWAAVESKADDGASSDPPTEATGAPEKKAGRPAATPAKPVADPREAKLAQLKALSEEMGLAFDDSGVSVVERAEHRRAIRRQKDDIEQQRAALNKEKGDFESNKGEKLARAEAILSALESGDPDGFAKHAGFKDFNDFQHNFLKRLADPNYGELRKLQQWKEEQEAERKKGETEAQQRAESQSRAEALSAYMGNLTATCQKSANPLVAAMAEDPVFLQAVFQIQKENWDPDTQQTLTVEQAIKKAAKGAKNDLESELRGLHERLNKGFASVGETAPAAAAKANGKKPAPKTAVVSATSTGGGGPPKKLGDMTTKEWAAYKAAKYAEAED